MRVEGRTLQAAHVIEELREQVAGQHPLAVGYRQDQTQQPVLVGLAASQHRGDPAFDGPLQGVPGFERADHEPGARAGVVPQPVQQGGRLVVHAVHGDERHLRAVGDVDEFDLGALAQLVDDPDVQDRVRCVDGHGDPFAGAG
ncbi:hypothetical protein SAVIM40S_02206 [Streptomyces avidinii]